MMHDARKLLLLPALAGALVLGACEGGTASGTGSVTLRLYDAPGDLTSATVQIKQIYLQGEVNGDSTANRVVLYTGTQSYDLLTLSGGTTVDLIKNVSVPAGRYSQLRFVIGDASITTQDGATYSKTDGTLQCPSCSSSGLKVKLPGGSVNVESGGNVIGLDFDVSQSFGRAAGNSGRWVMRPVITATNFELSGGIQGNVTAAAGVTLPVCGGAATDLTKFVPRATSGDVTLSGTTQTNGAFAVNGVTPGTYTLGYADRVGFANGDTLVFAAVPTPASVTVASGANATASYSVATASCKLAGQ